MLAAIRSGLVLACIVAALAADDSATYFPAKVSQIQPGSELWLARPGKEPIYVAADLFSYEALCKAIKARDEEGIKELIQADEVTIIPKGMRVRIIERKDYTSPRAVEVRILDEGDLKNIVVWVEARSVVVKVEKP